MEQPTIKIHSNRGLPIFSVFCGRHFSRPIFLKFYVPYMYLSIHLNIYFSRLIPQVAENAAARALSEAKPLAWRRPTPKAEGLQEGEVPREGGDRRGKRVGESIPDGLRPEASPPAGRSHMWKQDASPPAERERESILLNRRVYKDI